MSFPGAGLGVVLLPAPQEVPVSPHGRASLPARGLDGGWAQLCSHETGEVQRGSCGSSLQPHRTQPR